MRLNTYQEMAMYTKPEGTFEKRLQNYALGAAGEAGEFADKVKKVIHHGHTLEREEMAYELGDNLWYIALAADLLGYSLDEIAAMNINKLKTRYKNGFSKEDSIKRVDVKGD